MRIALLTNGIWPYVIGGMQKHSYFLCKYLAKNKIEVILVHTNQQADLDIEKLEYFTPEERQYITSIVLPAPRTAYFPGHYLYKSYRYSKAVFEELKQIKSVDFIISKSTTAWYLFKKGRLNNTPVGINIHGYEFMQKKANIRSILEGWLLRWPFIYVNQKADYVFSYGGKITGLIKKLNVPHKKIIELPAGIEEEWMTKEILPSKQKRVFVFTGRFERRKGIQELTSVIKELHGKYDFEFHFIGTIPETKKLNLTGIIYHGIIRDKEALQSILQKAQVLVCPSYAEGMPNVILEGMANGCSVIATDIGAVEDLVDSNTGWLIPVANPAALKSAIISAIQLDEIKLDEMRNKAFSKILENFTWNNVAKQTIKAIESRI